MVIYKIKVNKNADRETKELQKKFIELQKISDEMEKDIEQAQHVEEEVMRSAITI